MTERIRKDETDSSAQKFVPPVERPVQPGLASSNGDRPIGTGVKLGGDPNAKVQPTRYPARG